VFVNFGAGQYNDGEGGISVVELEVANGVNTLEMLAIYNDENSTLAGHLLVGFAYDLDGLQPVSPTDTITEDTNIYAVWGIVTP
jgi:hypothetical protein